MSVPPNDSSSRSRAYQRKRKAKEAVYKQNEIALVPIEKGFFHKPYGELERTLDALFAKLGFDTERKLSFDICDLAQDAGFILKEEEVVAELREVISETDEFPTVKKLYELKRVRLAIQIQKTGGQNHYRQLLQYDLPAKPNKYWTLDRTLDALRAKKKQLGRIPRQKEMDLGLSNAVTKHGGIARLWEMLGWETAKRPDGFWDEHILLKTIRQEVVPVLGHFPSNRELREMSRHDLANAISRNGGYPYLRKRYEQMIRKSVRKKQ